MILEYLNREVGQGDGRVTVLPGTLLVRLVHGRPLDEEGGQGLCPPVTRDVMPLRGVTVLEANVM